MGIVSTPGSDEDTGQGTDPNDPDYGRTVVPPANLEGEFPEATLVSAPRIKRAPYKIVNPMKFARKYGQFNREEILKNYELAKNLALQQLDTELQGLEKYAPAASALKRQEISVDNLFNQQQRSAQVASVMPEVSRQLAEQAGRAESYAAGRMPDTLEDRALELGLRSQAADRAAAGGFGATSSVSRKASDLMSAQQRIQLSQYGDQLLTGNIGTTANLMLAPTEYSQAGTEIRVTPEVGAGRLSAAALSELNAATTIPVTTSYQSTIQQRQFVTNLKQQTRMYNANNQFAADQYNAGTLNNFALQKFGYQVGYAGVLAGAETANNNTQFALSQQEKYGQIFQDAMAQSQAAQQTIATSQAGAAAVTAGINALPGIINGLNGLFNGGGSGGSGGGGGGLDVGGGGSGSTSTQYPATGMTSDNIEFGIDGPSVGGVQIPDTAAPEGSYIYPEADSGGGYADVSPDVNIAGTEEPDTFAFNASGEPVGSVYRSASGEYVPKSAGVGSPGFQFRSATGLPYSSQFEPSTNSVLNIAGISKTPGVLPNEVQVGSDYAGRPVYSSAALASGTDTSAGNRVIGTLGAVLNPLFNNSLSQEDIAKLNNIGYVSSDPNTLDELSQNAARGDSVGFINAALGKFGKGDVNSISNPPDANGLKAAHAMFEAMSSFNQVSPEQRSLLTAAFGLKATDFQGKRSLGEVIIPNTVKPGTKPVTAGQTLSWFAKGINAYPLTKKWDQYSAIAKIVAGSNDPNVVANTAQQLNLLGSGENGAEVPGVTEESLAKAGWTPAAYLGVGAVKGRAGTAVPNGYVEIGGDGTQTLAVPKGTAYTAQGAFFKNAVPSRNGQQNTNPNVTNAVDWSRGALGIYNMWARKPGMYSVVGSANIIAQNIDKFNMQRAIENQDPNLVTNYGQYGGAAVQGYNAYQQYQAGNKTGAALSGAQAGLTAGQAVATSLGYEATAEALGGYAGAAGAALQGYNAYQAWQRGDKEGAAASGAAMGATLATGEVGAGMAVAGAYQSYKGWGTGNTKNGVIGGSMMLAGMAMMGMPLIGAGLMAVAVIGNTAKTGKPGDQNNRDTIREAWQKNGFMVDKQYNVTLADGSLFNIGQDGHTGDHEITNKELINNPGEINKSGKLHAYECDYTNDLDYAANMGGTTLTRLLFGDKAKNIDQIGGQLGNAAIGNIGFNQAMSRENFDKMTANMRGFYAKAGIGSKQDIYQLANAAFAEGRASEADVAVMHQTADMLFDEDGFDLATQLLGGRHNGIKAGSEMVAADKTDDNERPTSGIVQGDIAQVAANLGNRPGVVGVPSGANLPKPTAGNFPNVIPGTYPAVYTPTGDYNEMMPGRPGYAGGNPSNNPWFNVVTGQNMTPGAKPIDTTGYVPYARNPASRMTKEEVQAMNASRYAEMK